MPAELLIPVSERDHRQGNDAAAITLVEYGDYQCPYCGEAYQIIKEAQRRMGHDLRFVFRNFPITQAHPFAELAAETAEAAAASGKFWLMHDALYENQENFGRELFAELAESLELDGQRLANDLEQGRYRRRVRDDFIGGVRSGVSGTPGFFLNGRRYQQSWDLDSLLAAFDAAKTGRWAS